MVLEQNVYKLFKMRMIVIKGDNRVNRGGSWNNNAQNCRSANRNNNSPDNSNNNLGFRLVFAPQLKRMDGFPLLNQLLSCPYANWANTILKISFSRLCPKNLILLFGKSIIASFSAISNELNQEPIKIKYEFVIAYGNCLY